MRLEPMQLEVLVSAVPDEGLLEHHGLLRKNDPRMVTCATLVKGRTAMSNEWLARRLAMGHPASMSQLVNRMRKDEMNQKSLKKYEKILKSKD